MKWSSFFVLLLLSAQLGLSQQVIEIPKENLPQQVFFNSAQAEAFCNEFFTKKIVVEILKEEMQRLAIPKSQFETHEGLVQALLGKIHRDRFKIMMKYQRGELTRNNITKYTIDLKKKYREEIILLLTDDLFRKEYISKNSPKEHEEHKQFIVKGDNKGGTVPGSGNRAAGDPCTNADLETCSFASWEIFDGQVDGSAPYSYVNVTPAVSGGIWTGGGSVSEDHYIVNSGNDPICGFPMVNPDGGSCSMMLGDYTNTGYGAASMRQTFLVDMNSANFTYSYAAVLQDPAGHGTNEKPYFKTRMWDQSGNPINCGDYEVIAGPPSSGGDPDFILIQYAGEDLYYKPWTTVFAPLYSVVGQNVTIEFTVGDCSQGGHFGYAYVEADCSSLDLMIGTPGGCGGPATLTAPAGVASYLWNTGATTQTITVNTSGTYSVTLTPVTGAQCSITLDTVVTISLSSPDAQFTSNAPQCGSNPVTFTDQSTGNGAPLVSWAWDFGDGNTSTSQSPTHSYATPGNYTVTLTVTDQGGCTDTQTLQITINPGPDATITPVGPLCVSDGPIILTAASPGGTWSATCGACINATTGQFDPAAAILGNNTITYSIAGACPAIDTEVIIVDDVSITNVVDTDVDCNGNCNGTITITATNATQYSINNGTTFQGNGNFTALCPGSFSILVESANGCQATSTATITEPPLLTLPPSQVDESCAGACDGEAVVAPQGGTPPYSYNWSNGSSGPAITSLCPGAYSVTVTDANGCSGIVNYTITGPPPVVINAIPTTPESCPGSCDGTITVTSAGAVNFSIDGGTNFQPSGNFTGVCAGTYNVVVTDANGCQATGTATVGTTSTLNLTVSNDTTICIGGTAQISANGSGGTPPLTYTWDNALPSQAAHSVSPASTTTYTVFVTDGNGCTTPPQSITVTLNPPLSIIVSQDVALCPGQSTTLTATASGGNGGPYNYSWDDGNGNIQGGSSISVTPGSTTTYTVTATDNCGTPAVSDQVTVTVNPLPVVSFVADSLSGCTPVVVNFTNNTNPALTGSCSWDFGDGTSSTNCNLTHTFTTPGCYDITLTVTSPDGCTSSSTINQYICVYPYPTAEFSASPWETDLWNTQVNFVNQSSGAATYQWDFAGLGSSSSVSPSFIFPDETPGNYEVCLTVSNTYGCVDNVCHEIIVNDIFLIYVPNAFTPDGDGINDYFFPVIHGAQPETYEFMVFNRWGELIYETNDLAGYWDGTHRSMPAIVDVYVWKIKLKDAIEGKKRVYYGHVSLVR